MNQPAFDYDQAFARTIGWITQDESEILRSKKIAIAGLGGVGGYHLLTHCRLGLEQFNIADPDHFELVNFNRQAGASMRHLGRAKVEVMQELALDINPQANITAFGQGLHPNSFDVFFKDVDLFIDGLDFFALDIRAKAMAYCYEHQIPAITCAPLGMGASLLIFMPNKMSFEDYFKLEGHPLPEQALRFLTGLAPKSLHRKSLVDTSTIDLKQGKGPSTTIGCQLSAALIATQSLKLLLNRGPILCAPHSLHFDAYTYSNKVVWRPFGANNPLQILHRYLARKALSR